MAGGFERVAAEDAYRAAMRQKASKWPGRDSTRIEPVCAPALNPGFALPPGASVFTIGSCFARHIEFALAERGFAIPTLDFRVPKSELWAGTGMITGILNKYTPFSMLNEVEAVGRDDDGARFLVEAGEDQWWDGQLHSQQTVTRERGLKRRAKLRDLYARAIRGSALVIVTLGLIEAWWDEAEQLYLNDTVPIALVERHPGRFFFETLSIGQVRGAVERLIAGLHALNPAQKVLLTVSPVPFVRSFAGGDALVANSYSKAALRVAAEEAVRAHAHVDYFPSYESVTLSDRARAWEDDLVHVRPELIEHNVARMVAAYLAEPAVPASAPA